jgi:hypothetical protein
MNKYDPSQAPDPEESWNPQRYRRLLDYDAVKETVFHYYYGYRDKDRERLEKAFSSEIATMMGYIKNEEGGRDLFSMTMKQAIDEWVAPGYTPFECSDGIILSLDFFGDVGATVLFDFGGRYLESLQLSKIDGSWQIVNKFIVNP